MTAIATVVFACTACGFITPVPANRVGRTVKCPRCARPQAVGASPARPAPGRIAFVCAACDLRARIPERYAGTTVQCPRCTTPQALAAQAADDPRLAAISQLGLSALRESDPPRPSQDDQRERLAREERAAMALREQAALRDQAARLKQAALREQAAKRERAAAHAAEEPQPKRLIFTCGGCGYRGRLGHEFAGRRIRCPRCRSSQPVPSSPPGAPSQPTRAEVRSPPPVEPAAEPIRFRCASCGRRALIAGACAGRRVRCPDCRTVQIAVDRADGPTSGGTEWNPVVGPSEDADAPSSTKRTDRDPRNDVDQDDESGVEDGHATTAGESTGVEHQHRDEEAADPHDDHEETAASEPEDDGTDAGDDDLAESSAAESDAVALTTRRASRRTVRSGSRLRRPAIIAALALAIAAGVLALRSPPPLPPPPLTAVVEIGEVKAVISLGGRITAHREAVVRSRAAGVVARVLVEVGDRVNAGQVLLEIDREAEDRALRQAKAEFERAQARLAAARQNALIADKYLAADRQRAAAELASAESRARDAHARATRLATLHAKQLASEEDHQSAREAALQADSDVTIARSQADESRAQEMASQLKRQDVRAAEEQVALEKTAVDESEKRLTATRVVAPCDGTVVACAVAAGDDVDHAGGGTVLARVADLSRLSLVAAVPEAQVGRLAIGQLARLDVDGVNMPARVDRIAPVATGEGGSATVEVRLELEGGALLQPGRTVNAVVIIATRRGVPTLPADALVTRRGSHVATVLTPGGIEERIVATGLASDERVEIISGLVVGDRVLLQRGTP